MANKSNNGVGYNTNITILEKNKNYKNYNCSDDGFLPFSFGEGAEAPQEDSVPKEGVLVAPTLTGDQIKRAIFSLFDNGEGTPQRYKFTLTLNLEDDTSAHFIANLTKDMRNFRKHIPDVCKDNLVEWAKEYNKLINERVGHKPWLGKFHQNTKGEGSRVIEPWTVIGVYYDYDNKGWSGNLVFDEWMVEFDLFQETLSSKQRAAGCIGTELWVNPKFEIKNRPLTWAEQRRLNNAK